MKNSGFFLLSYLVCSQIWLNHLQLHHKIERKKKTLLIGDGYWDLCLKSPFDIVYVARGKGGLWLICSGQVLRKIILVAAMGEDRDLLWIKQAREKKQQHTSFNLSHCTGSLLVLLEALEIQECWNMVLSLFIDWSSVQLQICSLLLLTNPGQWIYICK